MMRKLLLFFLLTIIPQLTVAQAPGADCGSAVALTLVPGGTITTGQQSNAGLGNNYPVGTSNVCSVTGIYGNALDGVYSITVTTAGNYTFEFLANGPSTQWNSLAIHSGCPPNNGNCDGDNTRGFVTNNNKNGSTTTNLTPGTYYILIDSFVGVTPVASFELLITSPIENDLCSTATTLNCGSTLAGTTVGTTNIASGTGCTISNYGAWYTFVGDGDQTTITSTASGGYDHEMAIVSGSCGSLTNIDCEDASGTNGTESYTFITTNGTTYYIYIADYFSGGTATDTGIFTISRTCLPVTPPTNDDCAGAIPLSVNIPCSYTTYSNQFASASAGAPAPGCAGYSGGDVWFTVTVPASGNIIIETDTGGITDSGMAIYSGTCGSLALIECDDDDSSNGFLMSSITRTGLTPGTTIYIRVWEYGNDNNGTFDICVTEPPPPPTNDEPCTAISLTPGQSCTGTSGYIEGASNSGIDPCGGTPNDDVWYSFVATYTTHYIFLNNVIGSTTDLFHNVYGGFIAPDCSVAVGDNISCSDPNNSTVTGLTVGQTYFVQVFSWSGGSGATTSFDICITEPCQIPTPITTPTCPFIDVTPDTSTIAGSCGGAAAGSETLTADFLDIGDTSDYDVDAIAYNAGTFAALDAAAINTVSITDAGGNIDDEWSDITYSIPFDFCFYGSSVSNFVVGANNIISFNGSLANTASGYAFDENLPSTDQALFENAIYVSYHDIDPTAGGTIRYGSSTIDGCNVLVVIWDDVPMFYDNARLSTSMLVLHEDTNIIEIYIKEKVIDDGFFDPWNDGNAIVGVQNIGATQAVVAPCRNGLDDNWTATNEAWRFTPSGTSTASLQWLVNGTLNAAYDGQTSITVSPASTTTYTAQVTYTLCDSSTLVITDDSVITVNGGKVWDGSESSDWMDPDNWSDGAIPTAADCVIIPVTANDPILYDDDNGDGLYLTIETGANLTLTSDTGNDGFASSLTIQDNITIQGTGSLIVQDDASLIQVYDSSTLATLPSGPNTGEIELYRDTDIRQLDYVYWSSPVQNFDVSDVYGGFTPTNRIYRWRPTIATGTFNSGIPVCYGNWFSLGSGIMDLGKGYIVRGPTNHTAGVSTTTAVFTGVPNNGVITQPISSGNNSFGNSNYTYNPYGTDVLTVTPFDDNWNLIGNPYPSALDAQSFLTHPNNSIIEGAVHVWTHGIALGNNGDSFYDDFLLTYSVNDYVTYNFSGTNTYTDESFSGKIGSGQGFFVLALADFENGNVTFNNSMRDRTHRNTHFYRTANSNEDAPEDTNAIERHRIWLNLIDQNEAISSILVGYIEGATQEKDRLFDAYTREVNEISMYSKIGDERMIIQGRALPFDDNDQVPLGTVIPQAGEYTIAISNVDGLFSDDNQAIYLEDTYAGVIHNLRAAPYSFTETERIDYEDRFILRYTDDALSITDFDLSGLSIIAPKGDYIKVTSEQSPIESVIVYDLLGRVLFDKNSIKETEFILNSHNLSDGTYIVKATLVNGQSKAQKIVLKN